MAITKRTENDKIEVVNKWNIQIRTATVIEEDGAELSRSYHRHVLQPWASSYDADTKKWTHTATDILVKMQTYKQLQMQLGLMQTKQQQKLQRKQTYQNKNV